MGGTCSSGVDSIMFINKIYNFSSVVTLLWGYTLLSWKQESKRMRKEMKVLLFHLGSKETGTTLLNVSIAEGNSWVFTLKIFVFYSACHHISESAKLTRTKGMTECGLYFCNKTYLKEQTDGFLLISSEKHSDTAENKVKVEKVSAFSFQHFICFFKPVDIEE